MRIVIAATIAKITTRKIELISGKNVLSSTPINIVVKKVARAMIHIFFIRIPLKNLVTIEFAFKFLKFIISHKNSK